MLNLVPSNTELKGRALIAGFHGIGGTGYYAVRFLIKELGAKRVCCIDFNHLPAISSVYSGRIMTPFELYNKDDLYFLKSEVLASREIEEEFFRSFAELIMKSKIEEVGLIGGLDEALKNDNTDYRIALTSRMSESGKLIGEPILEEDRIIVGPVAILLNYFETYNFPAYAVLAYSSTERIDPRAAAHAIKFVSRRYGFKVDVTPLIKGAEQIEIELNQLEQRERRSSSPIYS